jgi:glycosyltransferase involved in cell wall biosynthesis
MKALLIISKFWPEYSGPGVRALNTYNYLKKDMSIQLDSLCGSVIFNSNKSYLFKTTQPSIIKNHQNLKNMRIKRIACKLFPENKINFFNKIFYYLNFNIEFFLTYFYLIKNDSKKYDYFHVYGNNSITNAALSYAKKNSIPVISEIVTPNRDFKIKQPFLFKIFQKSKFENLKIICISNRIFNDLKKKIETKKLIYKINPISFKFNFKKNILKKNFYLFNVGKFMPKKNQIFLLKVIKILPKNYFLTLVGPLEKKGMHASRDKKYFLEIKRMVKYYKIQNRVNIITKFIDNPKKYYHKSNLCLFPFKNEGLGTPVLESIASGRPVFVNDENKNFSEFYKYKTLLNIPLIPELWAKKILSISIHNKLLERNSKLLLSKYNSDQDNKIYKKIIKEIVKR